MHYKAIKFLTVFATTGLLIFSNSYIAKASDDTSTDDSNIAGISINISSYVDSSVNDSYYRLNKTTYNSSTLTSTINHPEYSDKCITTVDTSLNVRDLGNTSGNIIGKMYAYGLATVIEKGESWSKIQSGNVTGYVCNDYLLFGDDAYDFVKNNCPYSALVTTDILNVRMTPSTESTIIGKINQGESYSIISEEGTWIKIAYGDQSGYISAEYVQKGYATTTALLIEEMVSTKRNDVVEYAMEFLGNPYVYGGTSLTNGTDCSGFTQGVYAYFGYSLDRTSSSQRSNGTEVSLDEVQPGDLIFYSGHVAIYIGNGQIIHASTPSTGIIISSMYMQTPVCARRIIN